jgi:glycine dehydrogenase
MQTANDLDALEAQGAFIARHIGPDDQDIAKMLAVIGVASIDDLIAQTIPGGIRSHEKLDLPDPIDEAALLAELAGLAARNDSTTKSLIGRGYYGTHTPPVILRNVLENPGWYTAYTPYQPEISQGRLEALLNFQTVITDLTGLPIANASLLDEATAAAEAAAMARNAAKSKTNVIAVAADLHPQTRAVLQTRANPLGWTVTEFAAGDTDAIAHAKPFAVILQYPGSTGAIRCLKAEIAAAQSAGALAIVAADLLSLTLLTPPGEMGADIVVGSAQRFGVPMGFGGPHAAFFATKEIFKRQMPGRLVGRSLDAAGAPALRLALQTREQHIRREKATSNICTAQVLLAIIAGFYAVWHGPQGLRRIAARINLQARLLATAAQNAGYTLRHDRFFDTVTIETGADTKSLLASAAAANFNLATSGDALTIAFDETVTRADLEKLVALFGAVPGPANPSIPDSLARTSDFLTHPVFRKHHAEHAMLRYLKRLEDLDIALNRGMIPLGSCTMKLNAAAEMLPITWPGFANIHPFAPPAQTQGYATLIERLQNMLARATGFAAVSLQPNAGSQGEYAGLLAIRAYHTQNGAPHRRICLIPSSAHGTNPASAAMAGLDIVVIGCDPHGNIDIADLRAKAEKYADRLAALMITYPSTHGVFEDAIKDIIGIVHAHGGQVYMDGANMNAQLGLTSPGAIGADVCHLNLHKTFCIPHGGGGPGIGPIAVAAHLAPYLPNHPARPEAGPATGIGPVSAAPFGSAGILPISYAYMRLMGAGGLRRATEIAILSANYIAARLKPHFPILYTGRAGTVAHECILDCRAFAATAGIQVEDIAKRLQDYGFHAPTMSWPVPGTLMVEPTESEPLDEIDRFCDAMISIRAEIAAIAENRADRLDNVLKNAPHTAAELASAAWPHPYTREQAAFPRPSPAKYWPPVKRVDNAYGDRNLACTCAPLAAYADAAPVPLHLAGRAGVGGAGHDPSSLGVSTTSVG